MKPDAKFSVKARHKARILIIQALYQVQFNHTNLSELINQYREDETAKKVDFEYFQTIITGILEKLSEIDATILSYCPKKNISELTSIELSVLRLSSYELEYRLDLPYRVIINEALELSKKFGTEEGYKFVNGVLDKLAKHLRKAELN